MALDTYKSLVGGDHISIANTLHSMGYVFGEYVTILLNLISIYDNTFSLLRLLLAVRCTQ